MQPVAARRAVAFVGEVGAVRRMFPQPDCLCCMAIPTRDIGASLAKLLSRNRGPDHHDPERRISPDYAVAATLTDDVIAMALTFRSGRRYCCMEWGCHLDLHDGGRWDGLRELLGADGVVVPERLTLRLTVAVEDGARFFDPFKPEPGRPGRYVFAAAHACRYEVETRERVGPEEGEQIV
jgi:hypothetical protein